MPAPILSCVLHPFPQATAPPTVDLTVTVRFQPPLLRMEYRLSGALDALRIPDPVPAGFTEGLWEHTCFEAFLGPRDGPDYVEVNAAPSGAWALFGFHGYREGMTRLEAAPQLHVEHQKDALALDLTLDLQKVTQGWMQQPLRLGLAAVLEARDGSRSFWALHHPAERPDFHHPQAFALTLDPERTP